MSRSPKRITNGVFDTMRMRIPIEDIHIGERKRPPDQRKVDEIADSISKVGLLAHPIVCMRDGIRLDDGDPVDNVPVLICGLHRILALTKIGEKYVECEVAKVDDLHAELMEITENLARAELTALERDSQIARWIELTDAKAAAQVSAQVAPKSPGRPESGINAAARELGLDRTDAQRAAKVAALSEEAKIAAVKAGLDDNRTALLAAAKESTPAQQAAKLVEWNTEREVAAAIAAARKKANKTSADRMKVIDDEEAMLSFYQAWADVPIDRRAEALREIDAHAYLNEAIS